MKLAFTDSGFGIPPEIISKMMTPFYTTKAPGKGTGLGLSISVKIIEAHGGNLSYDPTNPHTSFMINIPVILTSTN